MKEKRECKNKKKSEVCIKNAPPFKDKEKYIFFKNKETYGKLKTNKKSNYHRKKNKKNKTKRSFQKPPSEKLKWSG